MNDPRLITREEGNHITDVTVFSRSAHVIRKATVMVEPGVNRILMSVAAYSVDADSTQAMVRGEGTILSTQYKSVPSLSAVQEDVQKVMEHRNDLLRQSRSLVSQQKVLEKKSQFLEAMLGLADSESAGAVKVQFPEMDQLRAAMSFLDENYSEIAKADDEIDTRLEAIKEEITVVTQRLKSMKAPSDKKRHGIEVVFESARAQEIGIEVSYVTPDAAWEPVYKVDVPLELDSVHMTMFARITQHTGEHWRGANVSVSNVVPMRGASLPGLNSWTVGLPVRSRGAVMAGVASSKAMSRIMSPAAELDEAAYQEELEVADVAEVAEAEERELPTAFEYGISQPVDIDSGHGESLQPLFTREVKGEFFHYAVPHADQATYLVCQAIPDRVLIAGRLNVHFGGRFVGRTSLAEKKPGEDLLVNLGPDRGVRVTRQKITDKANETFFGVMDRSTTAKELEYHITIENLKNEPVRVQVYDRIPVPATDRIQVKEVQLTPEPTASDYQKQAGVMQWALNLEPRSSQTIKTRFFIKYPKGSLPSGM